MRDQCFGQGERPKVIGGKGHVPPLRALGGLHLVHARIVNEPSERKMKIKDLRGGAVHTCHIRQIA